MKKRMSLVVAIFGVAFGLILLLLVAPVALFTAGKNDSLAEIIGTSILVLSVLPASILAMYSRISAGIWLTAVGSYAAAVSAWNTYTVLSAKAIHASPGEVLGSTLMGMLAVLFGLFFLITGAIGWPNLMRRRAAGSVDGSR